MAFSGKSETQLQEEICRSPKARQGSWTAGRNRIGTLQAQLPAGAWPTHRVTGATSYQRVLSAWEKKVHLVGS